MSKKPPTSTPLASSAQRPDNPTQGYQAFYLVPPPPTSPSPFAWDQQSMINAVMSNISMQQQQQADWYLNSGASSHITCNASNLVKLYCASQHTLTSFFVGNGSHLPATHTSPLAPSSLKMYVVSPNVVKNLMYLCKFTTDTFVL